MTQQAYTNIEKVDEILAQVEEILTESIGRYQAQRFISIFTQLQGMTDRKGRNFFVEIYQAGVERAQSNQKEKLT